MTDQEKKEYNYILRQLCEAREIICSMISEYNKREQIDISTIKRGNELLKKGLYKER